MVDQETNTARSTITAEVLLLCTVITLSTSINSLTTHCTKCMELDIYFVREKVLILTLLVASITSEEQVTDALKQALSWSSNPILIHQYHIFLFNLPCTQLDLMHSLKCFPPTLIISFFLVCVSIQSNSSKL